MPRQLITDSPVDVIDALGLDSATTYSVQAESPYLDLVHLDDSDDAPVDLTIGRKIKNLETINGARAGAGGKIWAWAPGKSDATKIHINIYEAA